MIKLIDILENHFWYPVVLVYICLMAFAVTLIAGFIIL
jgi:hypothetical protein